MDYDIYEQDGSAQKSWGCAVNKIETHTLAARDDAQCLFEITCGVPDVILYAEHPGLATAPLPSRIGLTYWGWLYLCVAYYVLNNHCVRHLYLNNTVVDTSTSIAYTHHNVTFVGLQSKDICVYIMTMIDVLYARIALVHNETPWNVSQVYLSLNVDAQNTPCERLQELCLGINNAYNVFYSISDNPPPQIITTVVPKVCSFIAPESWLTSLHNGAT